MYSIVVDFGSPHFGQVLIILLYFQQRFNLSTVRKPKKPPKPKKAKKKKKDKKVIKDVRFFNGKMTDGQALMKPDPEPDEVIELEVKVEVRQGVISLYTLHKYIVIKNRSIRKYISMNYCDPYE